jgi:hypothetical protein
MANESFPSRNRPPLGLPPGSVRALLTLLIVAVVIVEVVREHVVPPLWTETLMIALAHYFTSRRFVQLPPDVIRRMEQEGTLEREVHPLYLPRHSIRAIIVLAFVGLAVYLYRTNRLGDLDALAIVGTVFAYFLGVVLRGVLAWWNRLQQKVTPAWWNDAKAAAVLLVLAGTAGLYFFDPNLVPLWLRNTTLGLVLFYFGSR